MNPPAVCIHKAWTPVGEHIHTQRCPGTQTETYTQIDTHPRPTCKTKTQRGPGPGPHFHREECACMQTHAHNAHTCTDMCTQSRDEQGPRSTGSQRTAVSLPLYSLHKQQLDTYKCQPLCQPRTQNRPLPTPGAHIPVREKGRHGVEMVIVLHTATGLRSFDPHKDPLELGGSAGR